MTVVAWSKAYVVLVR